MTVREATCNCRDDPKISSPESTRAVREEGWSPESPLGGRFWERTRSRRLVIGLPCDMVVSLHRR
jgi:hypothetical protein